MARMIPGFCPEGAPPGEKSVFSALRDGEGTDGWFVLHSLDIAEHVRQVEGEADFVVVVPYAGVLVIEVKSHRSIRRRNDGYWKLGKDAPTLRGPFQQASEARHSLRSYLQQTQVGIRSVPIISAVWFTSVRARTELPANPEWHEWEVMDSEDVGSATAAIRRTLAAGARHLRGKISNFASAGLGPEPATAERIARLLRPKFEIGTVPGDRRRSRQAELIFFIEEQYGALDAASDNPSVLFTGPAGSGKTLLAIESARREISVGKQGRFICYNNLLAKSVSSDLSKLEGLKVGTLHQQMLQIAGIGRVPADASSKFWKEELPERAIEVLIDSNQPPASDFLVIDEVQDIVSDLYLDVLDLLVKGGLSNGRLLYFGDFERQAIFEKEAGRECLRSRTPRLAMYKLLENCRNLPRIGYQVNMLTQLQPGYQRFRRQDDGVDPDFHKCNAGQDQTELLVAAIRGLKDEGYNLNEIVVLSPLRADSTAATSDDKWLYQILKPVDGISAPPGKVRFTTIHAFKGLEAPAVILTDLNESLTSDNFDSLLYVGLTRATDRLIALIEADTLRHALGGRL